MPRNLHYYRKECEYLLRRISDKDLRAEYTQLYRIVYDDVIALDDLLEDLRDEIKFRNFK